MIDGKSVVSPFTPYDGIGLHDSYIMMTVSAILHFLLGWYIHRVFPGENGVPSRWYFIFTKQFWGSAVCCRKKDENLDDYIAPIEQEGEYFEKVDFKDRKALVEIAGISKTFERRGTCGCRVIDKVEAVKDANLNVYEGEIFALLGHNGAGKTTTIHILCGITHATSGQARIMGADVTYQLEEARKHIGFCPQHDILFDYMTIEEHLRMVCEFRKVPRKEIKEEIEKVIDEVNLNEKRRTLSKNLSGGMKRRLSLAMAIVGGAKVLFLDEPTSGMDVFHRRGLWDVLKKIKESRAIILTTHFMEEADFLGDRIGIYAGGVLQCVGTSLFLKNKYGAGYTLSINKKGDQTVEQKEALVAMLNKELSGIEPLSDVALEISFRVPFDAASAIPEYAGSMPISVIFRSLKSTFFVFSVLL
eukprot:Trichotokara_eunicae@DN6013_c0_g1_i4.p1